MKTIDRLLDIKPCSLRMTDPYFKGMSYGVFDIETTGLSPAYGQVILTGFVTVKDGETRLRQYFAQSPSQEEEVIKATLAEIADLDYLVTFNGRMFDIPFLIKRAAKYGLLEAYRTPDLFDLLSEDAGSEEKRGDIRSKYDLDVFYIMKYYSDLGKFLGSMSQKNLERYMGIDHLRDDEISGLDSVRMYMNYASFPTREAEEKILLHNSDDVCQLTRLMEILTRSDFHRAMSRSGFPIRGGIVKSISTGKDELIIKGLSEKPMEYFSFPSEDRPFYFRMSGTDGTFEISVPCEREAGAQYIDAARLFPGLSDTGGMYETSLPKDIAELPGFVNGYLIIKEPGQTAGQDRCDWLSLNVFAGHLAERLLRDAFI